MSIDELGLSDRARNALRRNGIETVEYLLELTPRQLLCVRGVGKKLAAEIMSVLAQSAEKENSRTQ